MKILNLGQAQELAEKGRSVILATTAHLVRSIIPDFISLTEESENYRHKWCIDLSGEKGDPDDGLIEKKKTDQKFYFHFRPYLKKLLQDRDVSISDYNFFLAKCEQLYSICAYTTEGIVADLDHTLPGFDFSARLGRCSITSRHVLRFLRYKPGQSIMAEKHCDRSFLTLHVSESQPGLYLGDDKECFEAKANEMLCFFGLKAELLTGGNLSACRHFVKAMNNDWRWSVVFFTHIDIGKTEEEIEKIIEAEKSTYGTY
jgi:hypothetical protein